MSNIKDLNRRVNRIATEQEIQMRNARDSAVKIRRALDCLSEECLAELSPRFPQLNIIQGYTVDMLLENKHGERATVVEVAKQLEKYLDERLTELEEQL